MVVDCFYNQSKNSKISQSKTKLDIRNLFSYENCMMNAMDYGAFIAARYNSSQFDDQNSFPSIDNENSNSAEGGMNNTTNNNNKKDDSNILQRSKSDSNDTDESYMNSSMNQNLTMCSMNDNNSPVATKRARGRPRKLNPDGSYATNHIPLSNNLKTIQFNRRFNHEHPRNIIPEICRQVYKKGWMPGTGGAMAIKLNKHVFVTPSGVAKERVLPQDLFVVNERGELLDCPVQEKQLKLSDNTAVFLAIFTLRDAGSAIHTHSVNSVLVTLAWKGKEFVMTHQEMLKGLFKGDLNERYSNTDTVTIPIIENMPRESDMMARVSITMQAYPNINAILIRRHGLYVWGKDWKKAKAQLETLEYLFELALEMKKLGIDPGAVPSDENGITDDS